MVGKIACAQNFTLNGYKRATNPQLSQHGVIVFDDAMACGTSTTI